jgi:hypothetical protein
LFAALPLYWKNDGPWTIPRSDFRLPGLSTGGDVVEVQDRPERAAEQSGYAGGESAGAAGGAVGEGAQAFREEIEECRFLMRACRFNLQQNRFKKQACRCNLQENRRNKQAYRFITQENRLKKQDILFPTHID